MSDQTLLSATLDKSCALTDTGVTVEDRTYDSDEATLYGTIADIISEAITYNEETSSVEGVTLSYDAGSSTLTGTWDTHSVSVVVSSNSGTTSIESVIYDGIDLNHSVIDEFNAPSIYISEMLETIIGALG